MTLGQIHSDLTEGRISARDAAERAWMLSAPEAGHVVRRRIAQLVILLTGIGMLGWALVLASGGFQ